MIAAYRHSLTSFLNSLFLEYKKVKRTPKEFILPLESRGEIIIPIKKFSLLGRHHYGEDFYLTQKNSAPLKLEFNDIIHLISDHLAQELGTDSVQKSNFVDRVFRSNQNIELAISKRREEIVSLSEGELDFKTAEQGLFVGHTFHPTPKSRDEFSLDDYELYSPELGGSFPLEWVLLEDSIFGHIKSKGFKKEGWIESIYLNDFEDEFEARHKLKEGFSPFPLHPWQKKIIFKDQTIQSYLELQQILPIGAGQKKWYPTSSLRTLYRPDCDYMLKFSMNVKLTNSVRHLLVHELDRGLQVFDVFHHSQGQQFLSENPDFEVLYEPAYAGIKDKHGELLQETLLVGRFNPFKEKSETLVLATLTQDHPNFETNRLHYYAQQLSLEKKISVHEAKTLWFKEYLNRALGPLLLAQANYGILLGSHQQNMILEIENNLPKKSYFRDCNGTGYSALGIKLFSSQVKSLIKENGNILDTKTTNYLFGYYIIINSTFNLISALTHDGDATEEELIKELRQYLLGLKQKKLKDESFIDYLLFSPTLEHKGNFLCCFKNINENTTHNPLSIYTKIINPICERKTVYVAPP